MPYEFAPVGAAPARLFSRTEIPPSPLIGHVPPGEHRWLSLDSEAAYRKNPHPTLGADAVRYSINRHGYRTHEFERAAELNRGKLRIVCIGSSGAFGVGLPEHLTFAAVFTRLLADRAGREAITWNLALGGTGADYVTRMLYSAIHVLAPHVVLLTFFPFNRREYLGETGRIFESSGAAHWQHIVLNPEHWQFDRVARRVCNPYNDLINTVVNVKFWETLCDDARIPWLFTSEAFAEQFGPIEAMLRDPRRLVGPGMHDMIRTYRHDPATGLARDMLHAGMEPNRRIAENMLTRLVEIYPDALSRFSAASFDPQAGCSLTW